MDIRTLSRGAGAFCLLVGSIAFAIPVTVTEQDLDGAGQLRSAASHLGVTQLGNTLLLGQLLLVPAMIYAARLARYRSPKLAFSGGVIAALAWLCGLVAFAGTQAITYWSAQMPDNAAVATVLDKAGDDPVLVCQRPTTTRRWGASPATINVAPAGCPWRSTRSP